MNRYGIRTSMAQLLLGGMLIAAASAAMAEQKVLDRTFTVPPGGLLNVTADGARISISGSDANEVVVHMVAVASQSELDEIRMSASQVEDGITVEMKTDHQSWFRRGSRQAYIEVTVPRNYRVETRTSGGDVRLADVAGSARLRTAGGTIAATNTKGDLDGDTAGGDVRLDSVEGMIRVHTSGGTIDATSVRGDISANTAGGDVRLLRIDGKIRASTSGGSVHCELVGANRGIAANTSGGGITLTMPKDTKATLDAESFGGRINSDFPVSTSRWEQHRLNGLINGGGEAIRMRTSGGGITLSVGS